jgi:O-antigen ligase
MLRSKRLPALWWIGIAVGTITVAVSFRRYAWIELAVVVGVFTVASTGAARRRYLLGIAGLVMACAIGIALTWSQLQWSERFASLDPNETSSSNALAATNQGHFDDIFDGIDQIKAHPVFGLGVGVTWTGARTADWKPNTSMVHNTPVMVWIKFGILGLTVYFILYVVLFRSLWRRRRSPSIGGMFAFASLAFLAANFVVSMTVYAWSFETPEQGLLLFLMLAGAYPGRVASALGIAR